MRLSRAPLLMLLLALAPGLACRAPAPASPADAATASVRPGVNAPFLAPELDMPGFLDAFEGESREIAQQREALTDALDLARGMVVADVGAGTGLFMQPLADRVGLHGKVFALDISPGFVEHCRQRAAEAGLAQVDVRLCSPRSIGLPAGSCDVIFVCDTYHHFEYPRETAASLHAALRPGGTLVVVDFERIPGDSRDWVLNHVRCGRDVVIEELGAAGFELLGEVDVPGLRENYVLRFTRP